MNPLSLSLAPLMSLMSLMSLRFRAMTLLSCLAAAGVLALSGVSAAADTAAEETAAGVREPATASKPPEPQPEESPAGFFVGAEVFLGYSERQGTGHPYYDGFWAGDRPFTPSVAYGRWDDGKGHAAKLSFGLGRVFNGPGH